MLKRFVIAKSFRLHISKQKKIPGNIFFDISKFRKSSSRGLLGRQKLDVYHERKSVGSFWVDSIIIRARKSSRRGLMA